MNKVLMGDVIQLTEDVHMDNPEFPNLFISMKAGSLGLIVYIALDGSYLVDFSEWSPDMTLPLMWVKPHQAQPTGDYRPIIINGVQRHDPLH